MSLPSRPQSRAFASRARPWLVLLFAAWPVVTFAQSTPAISSLVAFSGSLANGAPVVGSDGALYGATATSNVVTGGLVYRLEADGSAIRTIYQLRLVDGYSPFAGLLAGPGERLYGTTNLGATDQINTSGTVFSLKQDGTDHTVLHRFAAYTSFNESGNAINTDGANPEAELVEGNDGFLYGVTRAGGPNGTGVVFKLLPDGTGFAVLHTFAPVTSEENVSPVVNADGLNPVAPLVAGADDYFYGTAAGGGTTGAGTIYRVRFDGSGFEVLHTFPALVASTTTAPTNTEGAVPLAGLTDGEDGRLYGVTSQGGSLGHGTVFAFDAVGGVYTVLYDFDGSKGSGPDGELLLAQDGKLYGTTVSGGTNTSGATTPYGTVFAMARDGSGFTSLHSFNGSDGSGPTGRLLQLDTSTFVGITQSGGNCGQGTVFQLSLTGATANGVTNCGQRSNSGSGGMAPALLLLLAVAGVVRRARAG
jgi:uncharacterized repeat protein (TIGR03803 family)